MLILYSALTMCSLGVLVFASRQKPHFQSVDRFVTYNWV